VTIFVFTNNVADVAKAVAVDFVAIDVLWGSVSIVDTLAVAIFAAVTIGFVGVNAKIVVGAAPSHGEASNLLGDIRQMALPLSIIRFPSAVV